MYQMQKDIRENLKQELVAIFERRFGHLDFWRLSKKWKQIRYAGEADIMLQLIEMEIERALIHHDPNYKSIYRKE